MINLIQDLTEKALTYALIGITFRVYSWTVFSIILYFLFKTFKTRLNTHTNLKIHYLFLLAIPFFLVNAATLSLNLETTTPLLLVDMFVFIGGLLTLIAFLSIHFYLKGQVSS